MKSKVSFISIFVNLLLTVTKILVGFLSSSTAVIASGIDSLTDIVSSTISFIGIKVSQKPADKKHPYGHHKYEVLSGLIITIIIFSSGIGIFYEAAKKLFNPEPLNLTLITFVAMAFSALVNGLMSKVKIYFGKKENSLALISDGYHSRVDFFASIVIFLGLFFTKYWIYSDSVLAIIASLYIIKGSFSIGKQAMESILDSSADDQVENKIKEIAKSQNVEMSSLKTQKKGSVVTANLEISLPSNLKIEEATKISDNFRNELIEKIDNLQYVVIQIKSHELESNFYKPKFGKGFSWNRKGKFKNTIEQAQGKGPDGYCICPKCGYKIKHQKGIPCTTVFCPKCKSKLERE